MRTLSPLPDRAKRLAARALMPVLPQARAGRMLYLFSHMRAGSSALSHVLCAHPGIAGYGESHVVHDSADAPARLVLNLARRGAWERRADWLFDKVLHDRLDAALPDAARAGHALVLLRRPGAALASLRALHTRTGVAEGASDAAALRYYTDRVTRLAALWESWPAPRRLGLTSEALMADPDAALARIGGWLGLALENAYIAPPAAGAEGAGDPGSLATRRIALRAPDPLPLPRDLPEALRQAAEDAHARLAALIRD